MDSEIDDVKMESESESILDLGEEAHRESCAEEDAEAYEEFKTRLGCLKLAQQVETTALALAKVAKENYKKVQISIYHEVYLAAEKKAAAATLRSQQAGKELEEIQDRLRSNAPNLKVIHNKMPARPGSPEPGRIIDESEDPAVIDSESPAETLSTNLNCDKISPVDDRKEAETALADLQQVLKPR